MRRGHAGPQQVCGVLSPDCPRQGRQSPKRDGTRKHQVARVGQACSVPLELDSIRGKRGKMRIEGLQVLFTLSANMKEKMGSQCREVGERLLVGMMLKPQLGVGWAQRRNACPHSVGPDRGCQERGSSRGWRREEAGAGGKDIPSQRRQHREGSGR